MKLDRAALWQLIALAVAVLLESFAVISIVLRTSFLPLGPIYPNLVSVAVFVLPVVVGVLSRRLEIAVLLAVLPFWALSVVYLAVFAPLWYVDLFQIGVLAERVAGATILLGSLGLFGWLLRRVIPGLKTAV